MSLAYESEALQHPAELDAFSDLIKIEGVSSYLEIGAKFGGSLWRIAQVLPPRSRIIAVDLPGGTIKWAKSEPSLRACIERLRAMDHDATVIWGDSTNPAVIELVQQYGPYDLTLIDANHTLPYIKQDWQNYGLISRIVAFHDIAWHRPADRKESYSRIDVPQFWNELKNGGRHVEIKLDPSGQDNGIGVLWR